MPRPRRSVTGTSIPTARKGSCETGLKSGMLVFARQRDPRHRPDVHGPPSPVGFGISGLWVRRLLGQRGRIGTALTCEADRPTRVAPRPNFFTRRERCSQLSWRVPSSRSPTFPIAVVGPAVINAAEDTCGPVQSARRRRACRCRSGPASMSPSPGWSGAAVHPSEGSAYPRGRPWLRQAVRRSWPAASVGRLAAV